VKLRVPGHILEIPAYVPGKPIEELERERGVSGSIKLASNENPLGPSPRAVAALRETLGGLHRYPDSSGRELCGRLAAFHGLSPGNILLGNGSDEIIGLLGQAFLEPGDEVLMTRPSFAMYEITARAAGAVPVMVPLDGSYRSDLAAMAARVTPRTRMVFVNTPLNPTGTIVTRAALEAFMAALPADVVLVLDEAYIDFVRDPAHPDSRAYADGARPVVGLRTFSKAYGLAGLRIGYGILPAEVAAVLHRVRPPFNVSLPAQTAAAAALGDVEFLAQTTALVHAGLERLGRGFRELGLESPESQSNFRLVRLGRPARPVFEALLDRGVIVRPLDNYGYPDALRVNAGLAHENERFLAALGEALAAAG
jgi:histidinol-phosphate aminotransferase